MTLDNQQFEKNPSKRVQANKHFVSLELNRPQKIRNTKLKS